MENTLAPRLHSAKPATLADLIELGVDVWCWCNACSHSSTVASTMLSERLGLPPEPIPGAMLSVIGVGIQRVAEKAAPANLTLDAAKVNPKPKRVAKR